jgi:uncharacterized membrane protein
LGGVKKYGGKGRSISQKGKQRLGKINLHESFNLMLLLEPIEETAFFEIHGTLPSLFPAYLKVDEVDHTIKKAIQREMDRRDDYVSGTYQLKHHQVYSFTKEEFRVPLYGYLHYK